MFRSLVIMALLTLPLACGKQAEGPVAPPAGAKSSAAPRFDGVYGAPVGKGEQGAPDQGMDLVRFVADGRVLTLSIPSSEGLEPAVRLLLGACSECASGKYELKDGVLRFVMKSKLGSVEYAGAVADDRLVAHWRSDINGVSREESFSFVHVVDDPDATPSSSDKGEKPSAEADPPTTPSLPEVALVPPGSSWYCFHGPTPGASSCERKLPACESANKAASATHKELKLTKCAKQATAWCYTMVQRSVAKGAAFCSSTEEDCKADVAGAAPETPDLTVSSCGKF